MTGKMHMSEDGWIINYKEDDVDKTIPVHPDDIDTIDQLRDIFDNIEARITANDSIEFIIIEHQKLSGVINYGKIF